MSSLQIQRNHVITVASPGAYSSTLIEAPLVRIIVEPSAMNGLRKRSQLMVDKLFTVPIGDIGSSIGCLETTVMAELDLALRDWLALH